MGSIKNKQKKGGVLTRPPEEAIKYVSGIQNIYASKQKALKKPQRRELESWLRVLWKTEGILVTVQSFLKSDEDRVRLALEVLREAAYFVSGLANNGRDPETILGQCAEVLGAIFKEKTGTCHWEKVGKLMAEKFPDALPPDDGGRDVRLWAYHLAKRYRKLRADPSLPI